MDEEQAKRIANFRYALIAPIVSRLALFPGEAQAAIVEAASKTYQIPGSTKNRVSPRTIERYLRKPVAVYPTKHLDALKETIDDIKGKIRIGEQPTFDTVDEMFAELERCDK